MAWKHLKIRILPYFLMAFVSTSPNPDQESAINHEAKPTGRWRWRANPPRGVPAGIGEVGRGLEERRP